MHAGTVYIVGAGPGDPSLISVRGRRYLAGADVVIHDHLVHPRLLRLAPPHAERIDVGAAAPQPLAQDAINLLLAEKAREDKIVLRLKWGDPFVFDSGGKEALFLHEQQIPFEVVPGVTAPVAGPCYAGVPVTYPGAGDTLVFVRGHEDGSNKPIRVDWEAITQLDGTVVCYAGPRQIPRVADALLAGGCSADESAAVIFDATLPRQRTVQGPLGALADQLKRSPEASAKPGILVVGRAAGLREHLRWFDERPLFGRRVVVTRSREQAGELIEMLEDLGAEAIEAPSIRVAPPADFAPLDAACARAGEFDWIIFAAANGVDWFIRRLLAGPGDIRSLKGPRLCAIGPATADRLAKFGIKVDLIPVESSVEAILDSLRAQTPLKGARVLCPKAEGREVIADELRKAGAEVTEVVAYRTIEESLPADDDFDLYKMLLEGQVDVVLFTSPSTVRGFARMIGEEQAADLLRTTVVACIGPVTAESAQRLGIEPTLVPAEYTIAGLMQALVDHYQAQPREPVARP